MVPVSFLYDHFYSFLFSYSVNCLWVLYIKCTLQIVLKCYYDDFRFFFNIGTTFHCNTGVLYWYYFKIRVSLWPLWGSSAIRFTILMEKKTLFSGIYFQAYPTVLVESYSQILILFIARCTMISWLYNVCSRYCCTIKRFVLSSLYLVF